VPAILLSTPAAAQVQAWRLVPELRIGSESAREYALTEARQLAVGADGTMYLAQPQDHTIRVFQADGRFLRYIGREGAGPGEFKDLGAIGLLGDSLWASDGGRIHIFRLDGSLVRTAPLRYDPVHPTLASGGGGYLLRDGSVAALPAFLPTLDERAWPGAVPVLRLAPDGAVRDTLGLIALDFLKLYTWQGVPALRLRPFQPMFLHAVDPNGAFFAYTAQDPAANRFTFTRVTISGDTIARVAITYQPVPVSRAARDSVIEAISRAGDTERPRGQVDAMLRAAPIPEHFPPVSQLTVSKDGMTWIRLQGRTTRQWLVLDASGVQIATVDGPRNMYLLSVSATHAWGLERDEFDVPTLVRYQIDRVGADQFS
jgi:hypothetical protein